MLVLAMDKNQFFFVWMICRSFVIAHSLFYIRELGRFTLCLGTRLWYKVWCVIP